MAASGMTVSLSQESIDSIKTSIEAVFTETNIDVVEIVFVCVAIVMLGIIFANIAWAGIVLATMACSRTCREAMLLHPTHPVRQDGYSDYRENDTAQEERLIGRNKEEARFRRP